MTEDVDDEELDRMLEDAVDKQSQINRSVMSKSSKKSRSSYKSKRPLTFAEMREKERVAESSKQAPGAYGKEVITFGKDVNHMTIFPKRYDKYQSGPYPG